jgi:hypothetical protein
MTKIPNLNMTEYIFSGKQFMRMDIMRRPSDIAQIRAGHFALSFPEPPGKDTSHKVI